MTYSDAGHVLSYSDYFPFGLKITARSSGNEGYRYRYGFNGKENDTDLSSSQLIQDYGFRVYNPVIGKFLSVDPLTKSYPWYTPYQFAGNKPIWAVDLDGLEEKYAIDPDLTLRIVLTNFYDLKHSVYNRALNFFAPPSDPSLKWQANYKVENGVELFETEFKQVPKEGFLKETALAVLDIVNIAGMRSVDPSDFVLSKSGNNTQTTRNLKEITSLNGRRIVNYDLKGQTITTKSGYKVTFNEYGFPDFSPFAKKTVKLNDMKGNYGSDFKEANELAGFNNTINGHKEKYPDYTWHHRKLDDDDSQEMYVEFFLSLNEIIDSYKYLDEIFKEEKVIPFAQSIGSPFICIGYDEYNLNKIFVFDDGFGLTFQEENLSLFLDSLREER